jgi:hypothetical protein
MTQDEIIEIAREAGIKHRTDEFYSEFCDGVYFDDFETFAKLVAAKEREACAKVCDRMAPIYEDLGGSALESAAEAIRARGQA